MTSPSVADSAEVEVYASWASILVRMVCPSVEANPCTKIHPAITEPEFTPLDLSYLSRSRVRLIGDGDLVVGSNC